MYKLRREHSLSASLSVSLSLPHGGLLHFAARTLAGETEVRREVVGWGVKGHPRRARGTILGMPLVSGSCRANKSRDICDFCDTLLRAPPSRTEAPLSCFLPILPSDFLVRRHRGGSPGSFSFSNAILFPCLVSHPRLPSARRRPAVLPSLGRAEANIIRPLWAGYFLRRAVARIRNK